MREIPAAIKARLKKAKKAIIKTHGEDVYAQAESGTFHPFTLVQLIDHPERPLKRM